MATDYLALSEENKGRYGTDIGEYGPKLLADRYSDRTHFIYEILQNAEDALRRRTGSAENGAVHFRLEADRLVVRHYGKHFDEADVRAVCSIGRSTKDEGSIGRFGIGFKSVYTVTDRPEIHSGDEHFAIDWFVRPIAIEPAASTGDATEIVLPLRPSDLQAYAEIVEGLKQLGPESLLFLKHIREIRWEASSGEHGLYLRDAPVEISPLVDQVTVLGQEAGEEDFEQSWLVFHRSVSNAGRDVGNLEAAFLYEFDADSSQRRLCAVDSSPLVVFFPTVVETHLGFLLQGPFSTTPSRDNITNHDPWNASLVADSAELVLDAMEWLRDNGLLDVQALQCLPLDATKFSKTFGPLFVRVKEALSTRPLLPCQGGVFAAADHVKLGRTTELRELLSPQQLGLLFGQGTTHWISGDITPDRTPEIYRYVRQELKVQEVTPETVLGRIDSVFLAQQSDEWLARFYAFLATQPALLARASGMAIIRLENGDHVTARHKGQPQAFFPTATATEFPTVRASVCSHPDAEKFLRTIGITEPDPVDNVVVNVLPKYQGTSISVTSAEYASDIEQILAAQRSDSTTQKDKLKAALEATKFVRVVDAQTKAPAYAIPRVSYVATDRLSALFEGVPGIWLVDNSTDVLRGEPIRDLLTGCGASRYLQPVSVPLQLDYKEARELRRQAGCEQSSGSEVFDDRTVRGLDAFLAALATLPPQERIQRAQTLWLALMDLADRNQAAFSGRYSWTYLTARSTTFDSALVKRLRDTAWVPDSVGELQRPEFIEFASLGWPAHPFLEGKIRFKPPILVSLALEAGIDPAVIDLIKKLGLTPEAIQEKFGAPAPPARPSTGVPPAAPQKLPGSSSRPLSTQQNPPTGGTPAGGMGHGPTGTPGSKPDSRPTGGTRPFTSYVGVHSKDPEPEEDDDASDPASHARKMELEASAISYICSQEPTLLPTPPGNPGFDLYAEDDAGRKNRWVEVKALRGAWNGRQAAMSAEQFRAAQTRGGAYWLYVVEFADDPTRMTLHRIPNPAGHAAYFLFDHGWADIARTLAKDDATAVDPVS